MRRLTDSTRNHHALAQRLLLLSDVAFFGQPFELFILLMDAIGDARLVSFTRRTGSLFYQLPDIALKDRDPIVELGQ